MNDFLRFDTAPVELLARTIEESVDGADPAALIGGELAGLVARIPSEEQVTLGAVVRLALLTDALCVAERAVQLDRRTTAAEAAYVEPLVKETLKYLGRFRRVYRDMADSDGPGVAPFLEQHARDGQKFGGRCKSTAWIGLSICKRAAELKRQPQFVDDYRDLVVRMVDELFDEAGSGSKEEKQRIVGELIELAPPSKPAADPRELAYCAPSSPEVFHAVAHGGEVFEPDPFDVDVIHAEARTAFSRLIDRAGEAKFGKMLLVKGDAGSGKTHLMRAFRNQVHGEHLGFVTYLQMSTSVSNYARYVLSKLIESWDRPYWGDAIPDPAISCLSDSVARDLSADELSLLRDDAIADSELDLLVNRATDKLLASATYRGVNVDLVRMMLYLQRREPARRARVLKYLRCEVLSAYDRGLVGDVSSLEGDEGPARMLAELGRLVAATGNGAMVLLVDQLEDVYNLDEAPARFRLAIDALRYVTDHVPTSVVVVACLGDFYTKLRGALAYPVLERLEKDPEPVQLTAGRSLTEIEEVVGLRLQRLFDRQGVRVREDQLLFPFRHEQLAARANQRTRDVLDWCRMHHEACVRAGRIVEPPVRDGEEAPGFTASSTKLDQDWNDCSATATEPPEDDSAKMKLLAAALGHAGNELVPRLSITVKSDGTYLEADLSGRKITVGLCEKGPQRGALGNQVDALRDRARAGNGVPIVVRSSEYPAPGKSMIAQKLKEVLKDGGCRVLVTDSDWRRLGAFESFLTRHRASPEFELWLQTERPLSSINAIKTMLEIVPALPGADAPAGLTKAAPPVSMPPTLGVRTEPQTRAVQATALTIGLTRGLAPQPVSIASKSLSTHAAFLGSSGSGKTTLALNIIEKLLQQGVPVLMVDRKGDLCTYASSAFWATSSGDADHDSAKKALRDVIDVCVFTPGEPKGRPLNLPVVPSGLEELPAHERGIAARYAASALGAMMGYRKSKSDDTRLGILGKAIELVGQSRAVEVLGIGHLVSVLDDEDPELVAAVGKLDPRHFHALVENLETLRLRYEHVLRADGERLSPELLFGVGNEGRPGRTRLSIVSTKFLGDNAAIDFWVARLLGELGRWASRHPADSLQAALFLDEADIYLPAQTKPATKEPMLDLLKRARSAGLGVFLATQSPGDLDYRCRDNIRTWFVGRVAEKTAVEKMKPLLSECRISVESKLATAKIGEFFKLQDGDVVELKATPSIMKTAQLAEDEILAAARQSAGNGR
jgi:energy-coupling factor transporter ATP-binding protein EcfA2